MPADVTRATSRPSEAARVRVPCGSGGGWQDKSRTLGFASCEGAAWRGAVGVRGLGWSQGPQESQVFICLGGSQQLPCREPKEGDWDGASPTAAR